MLETYQNLEETLPSEKLKPRRPTKTLGWIFLTWGIIVLISSIISSSTILAFIGLGLIFWGPLLLYITPEKQVRKNIFESILLPYIEDLTQIIKELKYLGKAVYLPPKYLKDFDECKIFLPQNINTTLPSIERIQDQSEKIFLENPKALLLIPPGYFLANLFEKKLGTSFTRIDFKHLKRNLPKLLVQDLEIIDEFELEKENSLIDTFSSQSINSSNSKYEIFRIKFSNSIFQEVNKKVEESSNIFETIGSPICSAIACSLAKVTGNAIIIKEINILNDGKTIEAQFQSLEPLTEVKRERVVSTTEMPHVKLNHMPISTKFRIAPPKLDFNTLLLVLGCIMLVWITWLTLNDFMNWGKDLIDIFLGSREGEIISLGIGMRVIHYLLLALGFLFSGLLLSFIKERTPEG